MLLNEFFDNRPLVIDQDDYEIRNYHKLDQILVQLCKLIVAGQKKDSNYYGMVAAAVLDPSQRIVFGINHKFDNTHRIHAERVAVNSYQQKHGPIPTGSIIITTLSPCNHPMSERHGDSCAELIDQTNVRKVYCGYEDPTQRKGSQDPRHFNLMETQNRSIRSLCEEFAQTFLNENAETKSTKAEAHYVTQSLTNKMCKDCTMFVPPTSCTAVEGTINPRGYCDYFKRRAK